MFIFGERLGPKNNDHTISYLHHYLSEYTSFSTMQVVQTRTCTQWCEQWRWSNIKIRYCENTLYDSWPYKILSGSTFFSNCSPLPKVMYLIGRRIAIPTVSYKSRGLIELLSTKYAHLVKIYDNFISADRRPAMLAP